MLPRAAWKLLTGNNIHLGNLIFVSLLSAKCLVLDFVVYKY